MRIGITGLIVIAMMLVMVPSAVGEAYDMAGQLKYVNGTPCGEGIRVCVENLNETIAGEPWCEYSFVDQGYIYWDYLVTGEASSEEKYIRTFAYTTDGKWEGEATHKLMDVRDDQVGAHYIFDIVLYEVPQETETFTKSLSAGWNLISLPLTPTDSSTSAVLSGVLQDAVKSYNTDTNQFVDATTMDPGVGYFVHVTTAGTWSYDGTAYTSISASLSTGLNCVGWTNTSAALPGALSSIDSSYRYVARWNAGTQSYKVYLPGAPAAFNDFEAMDRGEGYFIAATAGCTLAYS